MKLWWWKRRPPCTCDTADKIVAWLYDRKHVRKCPRYKP